MPLSPSEKAEFERFNKVVTNLAVEFVELKKAVMKKDEVTLLGKSKPGTMTLDDLEATIKVLKFYKQQGFTTIDL